MVSWETGWGKMSVMTVGSSQLFIKIMTLTRVLQIKVNIFRKTPIFIFSIETIYFSLEGRSVRLLYVQNIEYNPSSFFETDISHRLSWISWIFIYFHGFSLIFIYFRNFSKVFFDFD